jgi:hypothetical protein
MEWKSCVERREGRSAACGEVGPAFRDENGAAVNFLFAYGDCTGKGL